MTFNYDLNNLVVSPTNSQVAKDQVRFLIGDTNVNNQRLQDEEILFSLYNRHSIWGAAATCCYAISTLRSDLADSTEGPLRVNYSAQAKAWAARAVFYEAKAVALSGAYGYSGGISVSDVVMREQDPDRVAPQFNIGMDDNYYPVGPAGNEPDIPLDGGNAGAGGI